MKKSILLITILLLRSQFLFCEITLKKEPAKAIDTCFNNKEMQVINGVFIDLDDCERKDSINKSIISKQDSLLASKNEVVTGLRELEQKNYGLSKKLDESLQFQFKKFEQLEKENKQLSMQLKWQGVKIGASTGGTVAIALVLLILKTFKVF